MANQQDLDKLMAEAYVIFREQGKTQLAFNRWEELRKQKIAQIDELEKQLKNEVVEEDGNSSK